MKVYHFTKYSTFKKIWEKQTLRFAEQKGLNDILEVYKSYRARNPYALMEAKRQVEAYRQISLMKGTDEGCEYASTLMWGHYGDSGKGVCIEIDFDKIDLGENIHHQEVNYVDNLSTTVIPEVQSVQDIEAFITQKCADIFFTKLNCWKTENEYRLVCNIPEVESISIRGAVTTVYVSAGFGGFKSRKCCYLEKLVGDSIIVKQVGFRDKDNVLGSHLINTKTQREQGLKSAQNKRIAYVKKTLQDCAKRMDSNK